VKQCCTNQKNKRVLDEDM